MVSKTIISLKKCGGSSLKTIKTIVSKHRLDMDRLTPFMKKYLKSVAASRSLVQTKRKGASGSLKLSASGQKTETSKAKKSKKEGASTVKNIKAATKKAAKPKQKVPKKRSSLLKKLPSLKVKNGN